VHIFATTPDTSISLTATFLGCPYATPQSPQYPPSIATPVPEGPVTNNQVNHIIQPLQNIILNNGGLSPNGAARQLQPTLPAGGPPPPPPNAYWNGPRRICNFWGRGPAGAIFCP